MIETKKGGISLFLESTKLVGDVSVGICFPISCNGCAFNKLCGQAGCSSQCFPQGSEEAALAHALASAVRQVLCGDPLAVLKTKVGAVECVAHNGHLGLSWKVKGTGSAIRKSLGLAIKVLDPAKMFPAYSRCVKQLGGSVDKETFNYVADAAAKAIKSNLTVGIVGNAKLDKGKLDALLEIVAKKHGPSDTKGAKTKPSGHTDCDHSSLTEIKVTGWSSAILADYIRSKVKGLDPILCDKYLILPIKPAQWTTLSAKLKKGVKDFAQAKYSKVGANLPAVFGYLTLSSGNLCSDDVRSAINNKLSTASIESAILKGL